MTHFGVRDLVLAELEAAGGRGGKRADARLQAMRRAFALDLDPGDEPGRHDALASLWHSTVRAHRDAHSPFEGYLEAPGEIIRMHRHHGDRVADPLAALRSALLDLLVDLAVTRWALPPGMTVTAEQLRTYGFDPVDFPVDDDDW